MVPAKRYALARRHDTPRVPIRSSWSRQAGPAAQFRTPPENQILRGLIVGAPLGLMIWLLLAAFVWWIA